MSSGKFQFAVDRGGTFTDVWARCPSGKTCVMKLLSEDPANYLDAPREGIRRILQQVIYCCCAYNELFINLMSNFVITYVRAYYMNIS